MQKDISTDELSRRVELSGELFMSGYSCAQSVTAAFADLYGLTREQALLVSASFGAGIGRMRLTCGAACGMFLLAGLATGTTIADDREGKGRNYAVVRMLASRYREAAGSITCAEILQLRQAERSHMPEERTPEYYAKRPCVRMVKLAARIFADFIKESHNKIDTSVHD